MKPLKSLLLATAVAASPPAFAQTDAAKTAPVAENTGLGEIVVTARKTNEKLQEVPLTIKALSGADLRAQGITSISELSLHTPGLSYSPDFGRSGERPVIRGISALRTEAPQPVSVFIDGVFVRDGALSLGLEDAERVEIVKGPQSALYGRASYVGAINYITVKPGNEFKVNVSGTAAEAGEYALSGAATIPLMKDVLSVRLRGKHYEYGGQYTNSLTGNKIGTERTDAFGGLLSFKPSASFDALFGLDYSKDRDGLFAATIRSIPTQAGGVVTSQNGSTNVANGATCNGYTINIVGNNAVTGIPDAAVAASASARANGWPCGASNFSGTTVKRDEADLANYTDPVTGISYGNVAGLDRKIIRATGTLNFHFGDGYTLTSQTAYTHKTENTGADQSYNGTRFTPTFLGSSSWITYDRDRLNYFSQEVRLSSPQNQPFTWLIGGFYYKENFSGITSNVIIYSATLGATPDSLRPKTATSSRNIAGFARAQYKFNDAFKVSVEGRYGEERVTAGPTNLGNTTVASGTCTVIGQPCVLQGDRTFRDFSPRITADYKLSPHVLLYGQVAKGQKSGGFNTTAGLPASSFQYDGEKVWSYEVGLKSDLFDRRVRFNLAVFQNDISGLQLSNIAQYTSPINGFSTTTTIVNNVGKARTRGFEAELDLKPTKWLTLESNYAYTDAKALVGTESTNGTVFGGNLSVAGHTLPRSPSHSAALGASVDVPSGIGGVNFFARGDLVYQSRRYAEIQNLIWADPFVHINASVGVHGKEWRATAFVKNLTNDNTSLNGFRYLDPNTFRRTAVDFLPRLRQFGITLSYNY
jgi:outer membrane receptor protein involved in Fe transport